MICCAKFATIHPMSANTPSLPTRARRIAAKLHKKQDGICWLCGFEMLLPDQGKPTAFTVTLDHVKPKALGGSGCQANLKGAHKECNTVRGTDYPFDQANLLADHSIKCLIGQIKAGQLEKIKAQRAYIQNPPFPAAKIPAYAWTKDIEVIKRNDAGPFGEPAFVPPQQSNVDLALEYVKDVYVPGYLSMSVQITKRRQRIAEDAGYGGYAKRALADRPRAYHPDMPIEQR